MGRPQLDRFSDFVDKLVTIELVEERYIRSDRIVIVTDSHGSKQEVTNLSRGDHIIPVSRKYRIHVARVEAA